MSLLMDALKRAEESKRQADGKPGSTAAPDTPARSPLPSDVPRGPSLPDLSLHYDAVDADLAAVSANAAPLRRTPANTTAKTSDNGARDASDRAMARNVFAAKKKTAARPSSIGLFLGVAGIFAVGVCIYFGLQLRAASKGSLSLPVTASGVAQATPPQTLVPETPPQRLAAETPLPASASTDTNQPTPESVPTKASALSSLPHPSPAPVPRKAINAPPESPVHLDRTQPKSNQTLERAYEALQAGRLDEAQQGYEAVLRNDAKNVDALLGMATLAARQGQNDWAQAYYQRALESDPNDPTAQAGLFNTRGIANAGASESQLKTALSSQPESSALYFALGNLYARQERWSEAQQAYFNAYTLEPNNADFVFNLAVSLDHLHQNKLAAQYYQLALNTAGTNAASFDKQQAKARLADLQP